MEVRYTPTIPLANSRWCSCVSDMAKGLALCEEVHDGDAFRFGGCSGSVSSNSSIDTDMMSTGRARIGCLLEAILTKEQRPAKERRKHRGSGIGDKLITSR